MKVRVKFFAHFRELFGGAETQVELIGRGDVGTLLDSLCDSAERRRHVFDGPALKNQVVVMKNGTSVLSLGGLATPLDESDTVAVFPFLGGG